MESAVHPAKDFTLAARPRGLHLAPQRQRARQFAHIPRQTAEHPERSFQASGGGESGGSRERLEEVRRQGRRQGWPRIALQQGRERVPLPEHDAKGRSRKLAGGDIAAGCGCASVMSGDGFRNDMNIPPAQQRPPAVVDVLDEHEEALVEAAEVGEEISRGHQRTAAYVQRPGPRRQGDGVAQGIDRAAEFECAEAIELDLRARHAYVRAAEGVGKTFDRPRRELNVGIQKQEQLGARDASASIRAGSEAEVAPRLDQNHVRKARKGSRRRAVARAIVHHDRLGQYGLIAQRPEAVAKALAALVVDDYGGDGARFWRTGARGPQSRSPQRVASSGY